MKIALLQPKLSKRYRNQKQAYGSGNRPPETSLAVLDSWVSNYGNSKHEIEVFDPRKSAEDLSSEASNFNIFGMSDWFSNHEECIKLARKTREINPNVKIILGGRNASLLAKDILLKYSFVDYVVSGDGEQALLEIVENRDPQEISNLWYREGSKDQKFTNQSFTRLRDMPVWDFSHFQNVNERLKDYLEAQKEGLEPWLVPPVALFSFRGCVKAMKEDVCKYCTSSETHGRALLPGKLWEQIAHLNQEYGAEIFYMADDIFTTSPKRIEDISRAKPETARAKIRAYGYLPDLARLPSSKLERMAENLQNIGVFNLFYGSETYDPLVLKKVNKKGISIDETIRVVKTLKDKGNVRATMAYLLGLPGESKNSLQTNRDSFKKLLEVDDCIERLYISVGMPLKGSLWYQELQSNSQVQEDYLKKTSKPLETDDNPDYNFLSRLAIKYQTSTTPNQINRAVQQMANIALTKMPEHKIGGFMLEV